MSDCRRAIRAWLLALLASITPLQLGAQSNDGRSEQPSHQWVTRATVEFPDESYPFVGPLFASFAQSGGFVIASQRDRLLHRFDANGRFVRTIGRRGAGPGEFRAISGVVHVASDTLLVHDPTLRRISVFAPGGTFVRVDESGELVLCCARDGTSLQGRYVAPASDRVDAGIADFRRVSRSEKEESNRMGVEDRVLARTATRPPILVLGASDLGGGNFAFGGLMRLPILPVAGSVVSGDYLILADGTSNVVRTIDLHTSVERRIQLDIPPRPIAPGTITRTVDSLLQNLPQGAPRRQYEQALEKIVWPTVHTRIARLVSDGSGGAWIASPHEASGVVQWRWLTAAGEIAAHARLPAGTDLIAAKDSSAILLRDDPTTGERSILLVTLRPTRPDPQ